MKSISAVFTGLVLWAGVLGPAQAQAAATHCRVAKLPNGTQYWPIQKFDPAAADSGNGYNYDIVADWVPANRWIDDDDRMRIIPVVPPTNEMELAHTGTNGKRKARLTLRMDSSGLWAKGTDAVGTYVVYRLNDAADCDHDYADPGTSCKAFHFEYFLPGNSADLPEVGKNVMPIEEVDCTNEASQDDEGDGHHGPD